jgi:hypothetical protein
MSTRTTICAALLIGLTTSTPVLASSGGWYAHPDTHFMMENGANYSINTLKVARGQEGRTRLSRSKGQSGLPSPLPVTRADMSEPMVRRGLQKLGYSDIRQLDCSGNVCHAVAAWKGRDHGLRIESDTGRVRNEA